MRELVRQVTFNGFFYALEKKWTIEFFLNIFN